MTRGFTGRRAAIQSFNKILYSCLLCNALARVRGANRPTNRPDILNAVNFFRADTFW